MNLEVTSRVKPRILPVIVIAQFCCTSLWFAGNGVMEDLIRQYSLGQNALSHLTSAVQFGFISGTLLFAILTISDRFSPSRIFFICAGLGALVNMGMIYEQNSFISLFTFRFLTGFFLAGIYPVGMKIAADYFNRTLGVSLGFLVGALVLGTAFPHFLNMLTGTIEWKSVLYATSLLSLLGGIMMITLVADGPYRKTSKLFNPAAFFTIFRTEHFRSAAFGYFGHMWELYTFWAFTPVLLTWYAEYHPDVSLHISLWSFVIIGSGTLSCIAGGYLAEKFGTATIARASLFLSGVCCLIAPLLLLYTGKIVFLGFMLFWGLTVIADSPLFSTLVATYAEAKNKGTALTIVNCIGFSVTIASIQLMNFLVFRFDSVFIFIILAIGPLVGILATRAIDRKPV